MVAFSFYGKALRVWEKLFRKRLASKFSQLFFLHCYSQVASIFTFISDLSVNLIILKCLRSIESKKSLLTNVESKLQNLILLITIGDVKLEHCIVPSVPISPKNPKESWIVILFRDTVPQNLLLLSNVNFAIKSFQDFMFYVNMKTSNMVFLSRY